MIFYVTFKLFDGTSIAINPAHVAAIEEAGDGGRTTFIHLSAGERSYSVPHSLPDVLTKLYNGQPKV